MLYRKFGAALKVDSWLFLLYTCRNNYYLVLNGIIANMLEGYSESAGSSKSDVSQGSNYLRYDLYRGVDPQSSRRVEIVERRHQISGEEWLQNEIWRIAAEDLSKLDIDEKKNWILATIICYQKNRVENGAHILPIRIPPEIMLSHEGDNESPRGYLDSQGRPNYNSEVKDYILRVEKAAIIKRLEERLVEIDRAENDDAINFSDKALEEGEYQQKIIKNRQLRAATSRATPEDLSRIEDAKRVLREGGHDILEDISLSDLQEMTVRFCNQAIKDLEKKIVGLRNTDYNLYRRRLQDLPKERAKINGLLENEGLLDRVVKQERGHSEDYLHYLISNTGFLSIIMDQISPECNRFYLVVSSTRDACKRCAWKMEEVTEIMSRFFKGKVTSSEDVICKSIYFAAKPTLDRDRDSNSQSSSMSHYSNLSHPVTEDNLSSSTKYVFHIKPSEPSAAVSRGSAMNPLDGFVSSNLCSR